MAHMRARLYVFSVVSAILILGSGASHSSDKFWSLASYVDDNSGETITWLQQQSLDAIRDESGKETIYPLIGFECVPGSEPNIRLRIDWRRFISSFSTEVGFQADDGKTVWLKFAVDSTNNVTVSRSRADVRKLLQLLSNAKTVKLEIAPYSEPSIFANFDTSTFNSALDTLNEICE